MAWRLNVQFGTKKPLSSSTSSASDSRSSCGSASSAGNSSSNSASYSGSSTGSYSQSQSQSEASESKSSCSQSEITKTLRARKDEQSKLASVTGNKPTTNDNKSRNGKVRSLSACSSTRSEAGSVTEVSSSDEPSGAMDNIRTKRKLDKTQDAGMQSSKTAADQAKKLCGTLNQGDIGNSGKKDGAGAQRLVIMRHAERVDRVFPQWVKLAFYNGQYRPYDLNQICKLPKRFGSQLEYTSDAPITEIGMTTASMIGRGLSLLGNAPTAVYSSPALRCVQTAMSVAVASGLQTANVPQIQIEPGLFEWMAWYEQPPNWFTAHQLCERLQSANIDFQYQPIISIEKLRRDMRKESSSDYMQRTKDVINRILKNEPANARVLIVAHASTIDASRQLLGRTNFNAPLPRDEMDRMGLNYPYCATVLLDKDKDKWLLSKQTLPAITYMDFSSRINHDFFNR